MRIIYRTGILLSLIGLLVQSVYAAPSRQAFYRNFLQPYFQGQRLNYCMINGVCGLPVASLYCQMMGYERADRQMIANNVGQTNYLATDAHCTGWRCNGFKTIRCMSKITHEPPMPYHYRLMRFVYPRFNKYRVDWCYDGVHACGHAAAKSFCRRLGYLQARRFVIQKHVTATQAIGNQKLCFGKKCNAFREIVCYR